MSRRVLCFVILRAFPLRCGCSDPVIQKQLGIYHSSQTLQVRTEARSPSPMKAVTSCWRSREPTSKSHELFRLRSRSFYRWQEHRSSRYTKLHFQDRQTASSSRHKTSKLPWPDQPGEPITALGAHVQENTIPSALDFGIGFAPLPGTSHRLFPDDLPQAKQLVMAWCRWMRGDMKQRSQQAVNNILGWMGYGLGYSDAAADSDVEDRGAPTGCQEQPRGRHDRAAR